MIELLEAERPLAESHNLIELVSLSLRLQDRQRLRAMLNVKAAAAGDTQANRSS